MKLEKYREAAYEFTTKLSEVNRKLAFAGIAIIWIFKLQDGKVNSLPEEFMWPLGLIVFALSLDLLHYFYQSISWTIFHRLHEKKSGNEKDIKAPSWISNIAYAIFISKVISVSIGYILMFSYIFDKLFN